MLKLSLFSNLVQDLSLHFAPVQLQDCPILRAGRGNHQSCGKTNLQPNTTLLQLVLLKLNNKIMIIIISKFQLIYIGKNYCDGVDVRTSSASGFDNIISSLCCNPTLSPASTTLDQEMWSGGSGCSSPGPGCSSFRQQSNICSAQRWNHCLETFSLEPQTLHPILREVSLEPPEKKKVERM